MLSLLNSMPGAVAQGLIWGIMAIGLYITYKVLDVADLTVEGSLCTGGAVCVLMMLSAGAETALSVRYNFCSCRLNRYSLGVLSMLPSFNILLEKTNRLSKSPI